MTEENDRLVSPVDGEFGDSVPQCIDEYNKVRQYVVSETDVDVDIPSTGGNVSWWDRNKNWVIGVSAGVGGLILVLAVLKTIRRR